MHKSILSTSKHVFLICGKQNHFFFYSCKLVPKKLYLHVAFANQCCSAEVPICKPLLFFKGRQPHSPPGCCFASSRLVLPRAPNLVCGHPTLGSKPRSEAVQRRLYNMLPQAGDCQQSTQAVLSYRCLQQHPWDCRDIWGAEECDARGTRRPRSHGRLEASSASHGVGTVTVRVASPPSRHRPVMGNLPGAGHLLAGLTWEERSTRSF